MAIMVVGWTGTTATSKAKYAILLEFEGENHCFRLLAKLEVMRPEFAGVLHPVLDCLHLFKEVVESCFSWKLSPDFKEKIGNFSQNYADLITYSERILQEKLTVTWKVHAVCAHLITFLERHRQGMANIAEQVGEAAHYDMVPVLQRHKVAEDHPEFGQRQLKAVVKYASNRVFNMSGSV